MPSQPEAAAGLDAMRVWVLGSSLLLPLTLLFNPWRGVALGHWVVFAALVGLVLPGLALCAVRGGGLAFGTRRAAIGTLAFGLVMLTAFVPRVPAASLLPSFPLRWIPWASAVLLLAATSAAALGRSSRRRRFATFTLLLLGCAVHAIWLRGRLQSWNQRRQLSTTRALQRASDAVRDDARARGRLPTPSGVRLGELLSGQPGLRELSLVEVDGWGYPLCYGTLGHSFVVVSAGAFGEPDARHRPGPLSAWESDYVIRDATLFTWPAGSNASSPPDAEPWRGWRRPFRLVGASDIDCAVLAGPGAWLDAEAH